MICSTDYVLGIAGYINPDDQTDEQRDQDYQPDSARKALRLMIGIVPSVLIFLTALAVFLYPIDRKRHEEILLAIKQRKEAEEETDEGRERTDEADDDHSPLDVSDLNSKN